MIMYNKTTLGIFAIVATLGILTVSTALTLKINTSETILEEVDFSFSLNFRNTNLKAS
ncbi:MAG: hypothetical protein JO297_05010 [Nitrososphaeraceae archaeon]|nr:hypothetical protein [Nitrososphaeraceae archaeon]